MQTRRPPKLCTRCNQVMSKLVDRDICGDCYHSDLDEGARIDHEFRTNETHRRCEKCGAIPPAWPLKCQCPSLHHHESVDDETHVDVPASPESFRAMKDSIAIDDENQEPTSVEREDNMPGFNLDFEDGTPEVFKDPRKIY